MMSASARITEPGSFRDRNNRVFYRDGLVYRSLSVSALEAWDRLAATKFFGPLMAAGKIIATERAQEPGLMDADGPWVGVLKHARIPFISYPYEWSFGMLKDAALLQLELLLAALEEGMVLKDASAYNIQWRGTQPVFIDVVSFTPLRAGEPWVGYRQFCEMFLYPLFFAAYKGLAFQSWLRGRLDGIPVADCARLMSFRDGFRPGVVTHVHLQNQMQKRYNQTQQDVRGNLQSAGFRPEMIRANATRLQQIVKQLTWDPGPSEWSEYVDHTQYDQTAQQRKEQFVRQIVLSKRWRRVWDLGCNTGAYSKIAAENADCVVAMDADAACTERLYQTLKQEKHHTILPLVMALTDPSPNMGWRLLERKGLAERGKPDLVLCLALIHHIVISANVPLQEWIQMLADLGCAVIIEFVTREDPMVKTLLRNKEDLYTDYDLRYFEQSLAGAFAVRKREVLIPDMRILFHAEPQ